MRLAGLAFILVWAAAVPLCGQQGTEGDNAMVIRALEHEWVEGQTRNDNRALDLIFDNALVYVEYGRLVTKGEYLSRIKQAGPGVSEVVLEGMTVREFGNTVVTVGTYRERQRSSGQSGVKRWRFVDTWIFKKNGWVLVAAAAAPISK